MSIEEAPQGKEKWEIQRRIRELFELMSRNGTNANARSEYQKELRELQAKKNIH